MEMVKGTSVESGQTVWIPINRIASIRYPADNGHTLITWTDADGSITYETFKECPRDLEFGEIGPNVK
jgi:hypothetical protein